MEQIIQKCHHYQAREAVLFGSRAKDTATPYSDFDIAVSGVKDVDSLREALSDIPTLFTIDLVDLDTCRNELLLEDIKQYGRQIYKAV
jgi:predicted nucleotidyltransferase